MLYNVNEFLANQMRCNNKNLKIDYHIFLKNNLGEPNTIKNISSCSLLIFSCLCLKFKPFFFNADHSSLMTRSFLTLIK